MKVCPTCNAITFDDMDTCYECMERFADPHDMQDDLELLDAEGWPQVASHAATKENAVRKLEECVPHVADSSATEIPAAEGLTLTIGYQGEDGRPVNRASQSQARIHFKNGTVYIENLAPDASSSVA